MLKFLDRFRDLGILILRIGIGFMFINHGWPKISGGVETWKGLGMTMDNFGISFLPEAWGFLSAIAEFGGGILFAVGLFFRPVALMMALNMAVAVSFHLMSQGQTFMQASQPIELLIIFVSAFFIGPGKLSLDNLFSSKK